MYAPDQRQWMACGYEPARAGAVAWVHGGFDGDAPTTCPGYTCKLPDVVEVSRVRAHWKVGALVPACGGEQPTDAMLDAILVLDGETGAMESWTMTPKSKGGGRAD